jgi:hypothetical protein
MPRKQKKYHYLYKTTNNLSGKYYYGMHSTDNLNDGYHGSGKRLRYSINKYGKENHTIEILQFFSSRQELINKEKELINLNEIAKEECMNLMVGGQGGYTHKNKKNHLDAAKKGGQSLKKRLQEDFIFRKQFLDIRKKNNGIDKYNEDVKNGLRKVSNGFKDKKHSDLTKKIMSNRKKNTCIGIKNSQYESKWITNGIDNKKIKKYEILPKNWFYGRTIKN